MEEGFARADMTEALELDALEARLYRARDEARYFEDSTWPWLGRLACLPCGFFPLTLPCPSHPIAIARREVEAVRKVFSSLRVVNLKVLEQHKHVQQKGLDGAQKNVCKLSETLSEDKPNVAPGQQGMLQLDLGSAAFGVCELTSRDQTRAEQFRKQQLWSFTLELYQEEGRLEAISSELDNVYAGFSWSHEHIRVGIKAINELLEMFGPY
ncbi:hypothetical protein F5883DRAFT_554437 [Diaporthe sp. PMI_573]|nr:hypothetical protein F5883DRAFT_554437 [Diaporthaceae sp. PMI_573]